MADAEKLYMSFILSTQQTKTNIYANNVSPDETALYIVCHLVQDFLTDLQFASMEVSNLIQRRNSPLQKRRDERVKRKHFRA